MHLSARASLFGRGTCIAFIQVAVRARRLLASRQGYSGHTIRVSALLARGWVTNRRPSAYNPPWLLLLCPPFAHGSLYTCSTLFLSLSSYLHSQVTNIAMFVGAATGAIVSVYTFRA